MKEGCNENVLSTAKIPGFRLTLTSFIAQHLGNQQEYTLEGSPVHHRTRHGHVGTQPCCCEELCPHAFHVCYFNRNIEDNRGLLVFFLYLRTESQIGNRNVEIIGHTILLFHVDLWCFWSVSWDCLKESGLIIRPYITEDMTQNVVVAHGLLLKEWSRLISAGVLILSKRRHQD